MMARTENFKLGCFHGKLNPDNLTSEAKLRNDLFLIGSLRLNITENDVKYIRLIGYEVPLKSGASRVNCLDLLGYDQNHIPYIIELKKDSSTDSINKIIKQVNGYEHMFNDVSYFIEKEFKSKFHWDEFSFNSAPIKIILAHRTYFENKVIDKKNIDDRTYICSFSGLRKISKVDKKGKENITLLDQCGSNGYVNLKIHNK